MIAMFKWLQGPWEKVRGLLYEDLLHLESAVNQRHTATFNDANTLKPATIPLPASTLVGRESGSGGGFETITLGDGLEMDGTVLSATSAANRRSGIPGESGENGEDGPPGPPGPRGLQGLVGPIGMPGFDGTDGEDGIPLIGPTGSVGATGATGATGAAGSTGGPGAPGFDGTDGEDAFAHGPTTIFPVDSLTGLGAGVQAFIVTPTSANLAAALTDETGSGAAVFGTGPTLSAPVMSSLVSGGKTVTFPAATGMVPIIIGNSGTASGTTNSATETNLVVVTVPAGIMGTNGSLYIRALYKYVGTAGQKTIAIRFSGTSGDVATGYLLSATLAQNATSLSTGFFKTFQNANSASAQVASAGTSDVDNSDTVTVLAGTINTANVSYVNFNAKVVNSGDTAQLVAYTVIFYPGV